MARYLFDDETSGKTIVSLAAVLLFFYVVGIFSGKVALSLLPEQQGQLLAMQASVWAANPSGALAAGIRPVIGTFIWVFLAGLMSPGIVLVPLVVAVRGVAAGQAMAALACCGGKALLWLIVLFVPVELIWMAPVLLQGVRSCALSVKMITAPSHAWLSDAWRQRIGMRYLAGSAINALLLPVSYGVAYGLTRGMLWLLARG
nr:hypothetical protein [bacterium]